MPLQQHFLLGVHFDTLFIIGGNIFIAVKQKCISIKHDNNNSSYLKQIINSVLFCIYCLFVCFFIYCFVVFCLLVFFITQHKLIACNMLGSNLHIQE